MATEPQKTKLVNLLSETISSNESAIESLEESLLEVEEVISYFEPSCIGFDSRIVSLASSINNIKGEIVTLHANAYAVGCGTTVGISTIYQDVVRNRSYNISTSTYDGEDPYDVIVSTLLSSNVGYGTFLTYTKDDTTSIVGTGNSYADVGTCYGSHQGCTTPICTVYANSISSKDSQIYSLRAELSNLIGPVNAIKTERVDYQIRRYGDKYSIRTLTEENVRINNSLTILNNPTYDPYT